jgi:A/G-specific adenine glycosylase
LAKNGAAVPAGAIESFRAVVLEHHRERGRDLPWRRTRDPYRILVSEMMLQQTQVARVLPKYDLFLSAFPELRALATAHLSAVLEVWQGLGYNRRALALHKAAQIVAAHYEGRIPRSVSELRRLPGIGPATAAAVCVFAYGHPLVFIETNIRSAFLHHFFGGCEGVPDVDILPLIELTLDKQDPRRWYYALMDYGVWVKKTHSNPSRRSKHHTTQTPFEGSRRQLRAQVLRVMLATAAERPPVAITADRPPVGAETDAATGLDAARVGAQLTEWDRQEIQAVLHELAAEGFLTAGAGRYRIA